jgi:hypothetical protein
LILDQEALQAIMAETTIDGRFDGPLAEYARELGRRRPLVLFAFAPRSAGTFLRSAAIDAIGGQLARLVHAEGGRDGALYLPRVAAYYLGATADTVVTHLHMQASPANRHFLDAFGIRPIIMKRSIPDMLASLWSMIESDAGLPLGFAFQVPPDFAGLPESRKADVMIDLMGPWYVQYFAGWKSFAEAGSVCVLDYRDFCDDPAEVLEAALAHARVPQPYEVCRRAVGQTWLARRHFRCNYGNADKVMHNFTDRQLARLDRMVSHFAQLDDWRDDLLTPPAEMQATARGTA